METLTKSIVPVERKPAKLTEEAHNNLPELCRLLAQEKGVPSGTRIGALSLAILEALERRRTIKVQKAKVPA